MYQNHTPQDLYPLKEQYSFSCHDFYTVKKI